MCKNWILLALILDLKRRNDRSQAHIVINTVWMPSGYNERTSEAKKKKRNREKIMEE